MIFDGRARPADFADGTQSVWGGSYAAGARGLCVLDAEAKMWRILRSRLRQGHQTSSVPGTGSPSGALPRSPDP